MSDEVEDLNQEDDEFEYDPQIMELLDKINGSRDDLEKDLKDISDLKDKLSSLFPQELNYRNKFVLEEKIKAVTGFYSTMLNIRQELNKSMTSEIEIRRKLSAKGKNDDGIDVRKLAHQIEEARSQKVVFEREEPEPILESEPSTKEDEQPEPEQN